LEFTALANRIGGDVVERNSERSDRLIRTNNARFDDIQPLATVLCESPDDVAAAIGFIRQRGIESATRCGGHCFAGKSSTAGLLIDVSRMRSVSISNGLVTIGAGALLGEAYNTLLSSHRTIPGGTCPSVGIAGLSLGGGLGMLGRTQGLASDHLVGARVVLADGRIVDCDEHNHSELFWALRGAGTGNFGVVTQLVFRTLPVPRVVTTFSLIWPFDQAGRLIQAWLGLTYDAPDELAASLDLHLAGNPDEPAWVEVFGIMLGTQSDTGAALSQLTAQVASPATASIIEGSYLDALRYWAARAGERLDLPRAGSGARPYEVIKSEFFAQQLSADAIGELVKNFDTDRMEGELRNVDFSPWGAAYGRVAAEATAFVHRDAHYWIKHTSSLASGAPNHEKEAAKRWVDRSWRALRNWGTGGVFPNFPDPDLQNWGHAYYGSNYDRLLKLKRRFDPDNVFRFRQSIPVSGNG
jgi:FAD/FMN-containing dehydrogenase